MKTLDTLDPQEHFEIQGAWMQRLRTRDTERQGWRRLRETSGVLSALGELADELVTRGYARWQIMTLVCPQEGGPAERAEVFPPLRVAGLLGLLPNDLGDLLAWDERRLPWAEIANRMEQRLALT